MKKPVTEERVFCDFCEGEARAKCLVCGKDLCSNHTLLLPVLKSYRGKSAWENSGNTAEINEAKLNEIIGRLEV